MQSDLKLVSVIIPCFNQGQFIKEAIDSVLTQSYPNWECLLIDDGSIDNTQDVINPYLTDSRINYIYQENTGVSSARNLGISKSSGKYIQFLDGDDILEEEKLKSQVCFLEQNPYVDIVYGSTRYFYDGSFQNRYFIDSQGNTPTVDVQYFDQDQAVALAFRNLTTICATMYRRSVFENNTIFKNIIFEDWYFHLECALKGKIFHFERMDGSTSFVRLTASSQMIRHKRLGEKSPHIFPTAIDQLIKQYNYTMPFERPLIEKRSGWKELIRLFLPPIFLKVFRFLKVN